MLTEHNLHQPPHSPGSSRFSWEGADGADAPPVEEGGWGVYGMDSQGPGLQGRSGSCPPEMGNGGSRGKQEKSIHGKR